MVHVKTNRKSVEQKDTPAGAGSLAPPLCGHFLLHNVRLFSRIKGKDGYADIYPDTVSG
jgi:hypothetical protein